MRRSTLAFVLASATLAGCTNGSLNAPEAIRERITLQPFAGCSDLEQHLENAAIDYMKRTLDSYTQGERGVAGEGGFGGVAGPTADNSASGSGSSAPPASHTTTNTQVKGVDEADFVKNDGTRIFVLSGRTLYATRSWPAADLSLAGKLEIEGYPTEMFLDDHNRVVVLSGVVAQYPGVVEGGAAGAADVACADWRCGYSYANTTKITVVDVSTLSAPKVTGETYLPGNYAASRRIGGSVRVVLSDHFRWPEGVRFWPEWDYSGPYPYNDKAALTAALEQLKVKNEQLIRAATLEQWLPKGKRRLVESGQVVDVGYNCSDFYHSNAPTKLGVVTVATLNLDTPDAPPTRTSVLGEPGEIYASQSSLYIASRHWWWWPQPGQRDYTYLHKFDITDPNVAKYVASGGVDGHIVNQFSMDEHKGFFRVATTIATRVLDPVDPRNTWGRIETTNRVTVLGEDAGALVTVGRTEDLATGERIFSARFVDDRGFVVTFRQVDPLFTIDLSNPRAPRKVGELKVPGFSTYIHPIDDNHLLTIGVHQPEPDAQGNVSWDERRMKLTIFDVTDFGNPKEKFTELVGTAYGWSEANYQHKAFNYYPERKLLAIPFSDYRPAATNYWDAFVSDLRVFDVDAQTGIKLRGALSMKDVYVQNSDYEWTWYYSPWIRRSVMATSQTDEEFVYAISDAGIRVAPANALSSNLATVTFTKAK